jgi:hypothetical protein
MSPRALLLALAIALHVTAAHAGDAAALDPNEAAIEKGRQGVALYDQGEHAAALALFEEAERLYHSPVLVVYAARCNRKLDRLLAARALYQSVLDEAIADGAPKPWKQARADAAVEMAELAAEIPLVTVHVFNATAATRVTVDERPIEMDRGVEVDPGERRFAITDGAGVSEQTALIVRGDRTRRIDFELPRAVAPEPVVLPPPLPLFRPPPKPHLAPPEEGTDGFLVLAVALTSLGGTALVAGGIVGGAALAEASSAEGNLPPGCTSDLSCPAFEEGGIDEIYASTYTLASVADGLLIGGAVAAVAGIVLILVDPGGSRDAASFDGASLRLRF